MTVFLSHNNTNPKIKINLILTAKQKMQESISFLIKYK